MNVSDAYFSFFQILCFAHYPYSPEFMVVVVAVVGDIGTFSSESVSSHVPVNMFGIKCYGIFLFFIMVITLPII